MAFSYTLIDRENIGTRKMAWGTFTNGASDTGGDVDTGLACVEAAWLQVKGTAVDSNAPVINETFPVVGGIITIVTTADADGLWFAIGF